MATTTTRTVFELTVRAARGHEWKQHVRAFADTDADALRAAHAAAASGDPELRPISPLVVSLTEAMAKVLRDNPGAMIVDEIKEHRVLAEGEEPINEDGTSSEPLPVDVPTSSAEEE